MPSLEICQDKLACIRPNITIGGEGKIESKETWSSRGLLGREDKKYSWNNSSIYRRKYGLIYEMVEV